MYYSNHMASSPIYTVVYNTSCMRPSRVWCGSQRVENVRYKEPDNPVLDGHVGQVDLFKKK